MRPRLRAWISLVVLGVALVSVDVQAQGPFAAQIQAALRAFLVTAHTWTGTQTFTNIAVNGTCTGPGCASSSFTGDITITKADPSIIFVPGTATDTRFWTGVQDDAGTDDDDAYWIGAGATPGAANTVAFGTTTRAGGTQLGGLSNTNATHIDGFMTLFTSLASWSGVCIKELGGGLPTIASCGSGNRILHIQGQNNGANTQVISFDDGSSGIWEMRNGPNTLRPQVDNSQTLGDATHATTNVFSYKFIAAGTVAPAIAGNATLNTGSADSAGKVTATATAPSTAVITFGTVFARAPACFATNETTAVLARGVSTTTTLTIAGAFVSGDVVSYGCLGY